MKLILAFVLLLPSVFEIWLDRKGETSDGKRKDTLWLLFVALLLSAFLWKLSDVPPWKTLCLLLGWRLLLFDYLTSWLLIKNDVIVGKWFTYTGKTSKWDNFIAKVNPWVRLIVRVVLFGASLVWFLSL